MLDKVQKSNNLKYLVTVLQFQNHNKILNMKCIDDQQENSDMRKHELTCLLLLYLQTHPIFLYPVYKILLIRVVPVMDDECLKASCSLVFNLKLTTNRTVIQRGKDREERD
jgi:hypothetical protein